MSDDPFEKRLQREPLRQIPPAWRGEILSAARRAASPKSSIPDPRSVPGWRSWLWPNPLAWSGVAAAWLLIFALNFLAAESSPVSVATSRPSDDWLGVRMAMEMQRCLEAEFLELDFRAGLERPKPPAEPLPRTERIEPRKTCHA